jgi:hypothetical protein
MLILSEYRLIIVVYEVFQGVISRYWDIKSIYVDVLELHPLGKVVS